MTALVVISRSTLTFYYSDVDAPVSCELPPSAVSDMEVVGERELEEAVSSCLASVPKKGMVQAGMVVANDVCFSVPLEPEKEEETKKMLSVSCPFNRVATVSMKTPNGNIMTATNQDLYETIARVLEGCGFSITLVVPAVSLVSIGINADSTLDKTHVKRFFDAVGTLKSVSFDYAAPIPAVYEAQEVKPSTKKAKISPWLVVLIVAAIVYALVMVFVFLR